MDRAEFDVWRLICEGGRYGVLDAADPELAPLLAEAKELAERIDRWIIWDDDGLTRAELIAAGGLDVRAVPLARWQAMYEAEG
jgi:hypothetical protein